MVTVAGSKTSSSEISPNDDTSSPLFIHHSENHSSVIVTPELTTTNFATWKRSFLLAVSIRNKRGFLDGTISKPKENDSSFIAWNRCNDLLVAWLLRSISPSITSTVFYMNDASLICKTLNQRFSQPDEVRICHLQ